MPKKVAFCEAGYDMFYGAQQSLYTFLANMDRDSIVPVFLAPGEGELTQRISEIDIETIVIKQPSEMNEKGNLLNKGGVIGKIRTVFNCIKYIVKYVKFFKNSDIEMVYCNDIRSILTSGLAARLNGIPVIWYVRIDKKLGIYNCLAANIANEVVTIANNMQGIFNKKYIFKAKSKFKTIYTGINLEEIDTNKDSSFLRDELGLGKETRLVALIGSIQPRKGQKDLIKAVLEIKKKDYYKLDNTKFLIIGDLLNENQKGYYHELNILIKDNELEKDILFLGRRNDIIPIMKQLNLVVLPSYSEGLPRTILEAFACGCPVVATDVAGTGEIITDKKNGLLVTPGDVNQLSEALLFMLRNDINLEEFGKNGRQKIEEKFTLVRYVGTLQNLILRTSQRKKND